MRKRKVWAKGTIEERSRRLPDNQMTNLSSKCQGPGITIRPM
ncbi:MAG: DNA-binding response regulator, partial [Delftia sp.]|nr:DNA-binding response regulator [Delftia sp.]